MGRGGGVPWDLEPLLIDSYVFGGRLLQLGGREAPVIPAFMGQEAEKEESGRFNAIEQVLASCSKWKSQSSVSPDTEEKLSALPCCLFFKLEQSLES